MKIINISVKTLIICLILFKLPAFAIAQEKCDIPQGELKYSDLWKCKGKVVKIIGTLPRADKNPHHPNMVLQHPMVGNIDTHGLPQSYINFKGGQMPVSSTENINAKCSADVEIEGTIHAIDLKNKPGTKQSYRNLWIQAINYKCL